jgi:hypothetical protein
VKRLDIYRLPGIDPVTAGVLRHAGHPTVSDLARVDDVRALAAVTELEAERLGILRKAAQDMELEMEIFGEPGDAEEAQERRQATRQAHAFDGFLKAARRKT